MILTNRKISKELMYYRALSYRLKFSNDLKKKWDVLERGFEGELLYDSIYDEILSHLYVFRDIYLSIDNNILQCDALIITDSGLIINEIKNFKGIYTYENEKWYVRNMEISDDPISQLKRTTSKLVKLNYLYNISLRTEGKLIFPNPDFSLETSHQILPDSIIVRHQIRKYLYNLSNLKSSQQSESFVEIIREHIIENPFFNYSANFNQLRKGIYCRNCGNFSPRKISFHFQCDNCHHKDTIQTIILQALSDFNILFSDENLTRQKLFEFLDGQVANSTLNKYLPQYCKKINSGPATHYKFNYYDLNDALVNESRLRRYKDTPLTVVNNYTSD